ncbi:MAG: hypothetical protein ACI857_002976 [Arenicella sp.]|jgi:hypothetical protein
MKSIISAVAFLLLGFSSFSQMEGNRYMLSAKLISTPASQVDCGTLAVAQAYEFEVIMSSIDGLEQTVIPVVISCPELKGENFFKVGANYKMEVFDADQSGYSIFNQDVIDQYNIGTNYWAGDIDRIAD